MANASPIIGPIVLRIQLVVSFDVFISDIDPLPHLAINQLTFLHLGFDRGFIILQSLSLTSQGGSQFRVRETIFLLDLIYVDVDILIGNFYPRLADFRIEQLFRDELLQYFSVAAIDLVQWPSGKIPRHLALRIAGEIGQRVRLTIDHRNNLFDDSTLR